MRNVAGFAKDAGPWIHNKHQVKNNPIDLFLGGKLTEAPQHTTGYDLI